MSKAAVLWLAMACTAFVQGPPSKPDFSGRWTLNVAASEFPGARPSSATLSAVRSVEQKRNELRLKVERVSNGQKSGFNFVTIHVGERRSGHQLHDDGVVAVGFDDVVNTSDAGMAQGGKRMRLAFEASSPGGAGAPRRRHDFQRDIATKACVPRAKHLTYAAASERRHNLVQTDECAGNK